MVWLTDSTIFNRQQIETIVKFPFTDTLGITSLKADTIQMRYLAPRAPRGRAARRAPYNVGTGISSQVRPDLTDHFTAPAPFLQPDTSKIAFFELQKEEKTRQPYSMIKDTSNTCRYYLNTDLKTGHNYLFITDSAAFRSIYGDCSDSTGIRFFRPDSGNSFGKLILDIKGHYGGKIIQLLDNQEKLVKQIYLKDTIKLEFPLLEKGNYRVRAIFDLNNDGKWTTGDFDIGLAAGTGIILS